VTTRLCSQPKGERVETPHRPQGRIDLCPKGAVLSAPVLDAREPGLYDMQDVVGAERLRGRLLKRAIREQRIALFIGQVYWIKAC